MNIRITSTYKVFELPGITEDIYRLSANKAMTRTLENIMLSSALTKSELAD